MRTLTYYVNVSLDGYIAGPGGEIDVFPHAEDLLDLIRTEFPETVPTHLRDQLGTADAPNRRFDTVVMGRRTYEPALRAGIDSPYQHLRQYVVSSSLPTSHPGVTVVPEDPVGFLRALKHGDGGGIWLAGGGRLAGSLRDEIDELVVKRSPVVLGAGTPMFAGAFTATAYQRAASLDLPSGYTVTTYERA